MPKPMAKKASAEPAPSGKRGNCLTFPQVQIAEQAYKDAVDENPHLSCIGYKKLRLPSTVKRTTAYKVLGSLKDGKTAEEICAGMGDSRKWSSSKKTVTPQGIKKVKKMLKEDNSAKNVSGRLVAQKLGCGRTSAQKVIKETNYRPLKHVATSHKSETKRAKR